MILSSKNTGSAVKKTNYKSVSECKIQITKTARRKRRKLQHKKKYVPIIMSNQCIWWVVYIPSAEVKLTSKAAVERGLPQ